MGACAPVGSPLLKNISVQLIDDVRGVTIAAASTWKRIWGSWARTTSKPQRPRWAPPSPSARKSGRGRRSYFDRGGFLFHGKIKALADAAREGGLKF
jgi:large subunit ribosomal protein L18